MTLRSHWRQGQQVLRLFEKVLRSRCSVRVNTGCCSHAVWFSTSCHSSTDVGQPTPWTHPELLSEGQILPGISLRCIRERRAALANAMLPGSMAVISAAPVQFMSGIIPYPYRPSVDWLYYTGCQQPGGIGILEALGGEMGQRFTMFMPERSTEQCRWDGVTGNCVSAVEFFGADDGLPLEKFQEVLQVKAAGASAVFVDLSSTAMVAAVRRSLAWGSTNQVRELRLLTHRLRWVKSSEELSLLHGAASAVCEAFKAARSVARHEALVAAQLEFECRTRGASRMAFPSVVAGGSNSCTIHYSRNDRLLRAGELLLVDAGCERYGYVSDVTRTWAVGGSFSPPQRAVYEAVLSVHRSCLDLCRPGVSMRSIHDRSVQLLSEALKELGIGPQSLSKAHVMRFYPTAVGHWLGMDVHDCALLGMDMRLQPNVVLTIEPGLYIDNDPDVPPWLEEASPVSVEGNRRQF